MQYVPVLDNLLDDAIIVVQQHIPIMHRALRQRSRHLSDHMRRTDVRVRVDLQRLFQHRHKDIFGDHCLRPAVGELITNVLSGKRQFA